MFDEGSIAHAGWKTIGKRLRAEKPKGIVTVSAHWENPVNSPDVIGGCTLCAFCSVELIIVNVDSSNPLIYDFYGFPKHYYEQTFKSKGSQELVNDIKAALAERKLSVTEEKRGLDHGVWGK
jgi:aromatic ring-opening dioxygenase catalytic subunit (LigB family)